MGYAIIIDTKDGRRWIAGKGRVLITEPKNAMYYSHPSAARVAIEGLEQKLIGDLAIVRYYLVRWNKCTKYWLKELPMPSPQQVQKDFFR